MVAPKGGQGKTTLAINLAAGLAEVAPNSVVLVDADLQFGDITTALDLAPERTIVEPSRCGGRRDRAQDHAHPPRGGLLRRRERAIARNSATRSPPRRSARLIERLRGIFRYVIVDTTPGLGEHTLVVLEHVTDAVFVTNMGVPSLRACAPSSRCCARSGCCPATGTSCSTRPRRTAASPFKDAEHILGAPVDVEVPRSTAVLLASNQGVPLIHDDVRDPAAKAIRALVLRIAPEAVPKRSKIQRRRRSA